MPLASSETPQSLRGTHKKDSESPQRVAGEYVCDKIQDMLHFAALFPSISIAMISLASFLPFLIIYVIVTIVIIVIHHYALRQTMDFTTYVCQLELFLFEDCIKGVNRACSGGSTSNSYFIRSIKAHFNGYKEAYQSMKDPARFDALVALLQAEHKRRFPESASILELGFVGSYQAGVTLRPNQAANRRANMTIFFIDSSLHGRHLDARRHF